MHDATISAPTAGNASLAGKYLTFTLGQEFYGVAVLHVREIIRHTAITPLPHTHNYLKGVLNLRGKVIPIVDLRLRFNLAKADVAERTCIIVSQVKTSSNTRALMGFIVDGVEAVADIGASAIEPTPDFGANMETGYILGMAKLETKVVALLDIDKVASGDAEEAASR